MNDKQFNMRRDYQKVLDNPLKYTPDTIIRAKMFKQEAQSTSKGK